MIYSSCYHDINQRGRTSFGSRPNARVISSTPSRSTLASSSQGSNTHTHLNVTKKNRLCSHVKQREQCRDFLLRKPQNRFNIDSARRSQEEQEPGGARRSQEGLGKLNHLVLKKSLKDSWACRASFAAVRRAASALPMACDRIQIRRPCNIHKSS